MGKIYYSYEREYPFFITIEQEGQSVRLPASGYTGNFTKDPNNIMLSREDFARRLARIAVERKKPVQGRLF